MRSQASSSCGKLAGRPREQRFVRTSPPPLAQQLADKPIVSKNAITRLERGEADPRVSTVAAVERALQKAGIELHPNAENDETAVSAVAGIRDVQRCPRAGLGSPGSDITHACNDSARIMGASVESDSDRRTSMMFPAGVKWSMSKSRIGVAWGTRHTFLHFPS